MDAVFKFLSDTGLTENESKVYLYLAKKEAAKVREISQALKIGRVQLYRALNNLQKRGMVESSFEYPANYSAVPFENVLDLMVESKKEEAKNLETSKNDLLSQLVNYRADIASAVSDKFIVLEGRNYIYSKIKQMIQTAEKTIDVVSSGRGVIEAYRSGLFECGFNHPLKGKVLFRFLTSLSTVAQHCQEARISFKQAKEASVKFESRIGKFAEDYFLRFVLKDDNELLLFLNMNEEGNGNSKNDTGLWTNNRVLIHAFSVGFEHMWRNSQPLQAKFKEEDV